MKSIEFGSVEMPINTVGNSVTFNKKLLVQVGIGLGVLSIIFLYYNYKEKQQLKQLINTKKSS